MSPRDKKILDRIYDKHYGPDAKRVGKNCKAEKVEKALKGKEALKAVNKKLAKKGIPIQFAPGSTAPVAPGKPVTTGVNMVDQAKLGSRTQLMQEAQKRGIKYFRILTKDELTEVLSQTDKNYINGIIENAKNRWQAGWSKNKDKTQEPALVGQA